jgi:Leucine-rich repeat (LRR) protein
LRISHNDIQELPENITKIKTLMILNAYECKLESLPKDINKLTNLGYLALDHNKLKEIPDISTLNNLKNLNLSDNNL